MLYHFYQKKWRLKKIEKCTANLQGETEYMVHMKNLKQALSHGLFLKNVHKVKLIKIVQYAWLKLYICMNTDLTKIANNDFQK